MKAEDGDQATPKIVEEGRKASLNHVLTKDVVLLEFILDLVAILQVGSLQAQLSAEDVPKPWYGQSQH